MHKSFATIDSPEFINLQPMDINPLMSSCEIKVLYVGENRNHSYITKEVATEMSKTLRGAPIVGYYKESKGDFADHGEKITFDDEGIHFDCMTVPYGFVAPDAKVWFQKFDDYDDFGNITTREYLMTTGYLWTGQYEEAKLASEEGRPHSMELDKDTVKGNWSTNSNTGMEFFIINDAIFSKLCILGDDVEPCFEGSSVTAPNVSSSFSLDDDFKQTLYNMMQDLKFALEGGSKMADIAQTDSVVEENLNIQDNVEKTTEVEFEKTTEDTISTEEVTNVEGTTEEVTTEVEADTEFAKKEEEEKKEESDSDKSEDKEDSKEDSESEDKKDDEEEDKKKKYALLEEQYAELETKFAAVSAELESLRAYKANIEDAKKDELIQSFYMLDAEDKKEIIENKANYSLDEIESKLSVIYTRKSMIAEQEANKTEAPAEATTYSLAEDAISHSDWIEAALKTQETMNF